MHPNSSHSVVHNDSDHIKLQEYESFNPHLFEVGETHYLVYGILLPAFGLLSLLANLFVFVTLFHKNKTRGVSALSLLLQCLAWYDTCVSFLSLWVYAVPTLLVRHHYFLGYLHQVHPYLVPYLLPILHMGITGSDYLNLAAAYERYIALDRDFRKEKSPHHGCTPRSTWFYIGGILICTVAFNLPLVWECQTVFNEESGVLEVIPTALRQNAVYTQLYRLTWEFLVFKATPWLSFLILFLSLQDRIRTYTKTRKVRRQLSVEQYLELMDSRIVLGINLLFYVTNALPLYTSFCHILLFPVESDLERIGNLMLVLNSTFKLFIYVTLSQDFRVSVRRLFVDDVYHWSFEEEKNLHFLGHAKVASVVLAAETSPPSMNVSREEVDSLLTSGKEKEEQPVATN